MKLLSSLRWPFLVWQMVGTAPFTVAKKALVPVQNPKLQLYSAILFIVNVVLLILSMVFTSVYIAPTEKVVTWYNSLVTMLSIRLLTCIVVLEAILKVNRQTDLLQRITRVDFILRHKLRIHVDYKKHQFHNNLMTTVWVFGCFACIVSVFVVQHVGLKNKTEETFWLIYAIPFLMYSMNYHRMVSYVYEIRRRYQMLNCFLEDICTAQQRRSLNDDLLANGRIENLISKSQLIDFRNAYQILYEASNVVNDTFWWSLPLCIGIDFHLLLMNSYGVFAVLLLRGEVIILGVVVSWGSMNIAHLLLLSHACHSASKEASMTPAILHKIDLRDCDDSFCELILQFSSQCVHQVVYFSAFGLFPVDFSMILMITGAIITYLIFLIQFALMDLKKMEAAAALATEVTTVPNLNSF